MADLPSHKTAHPYLELRDLHLTGRRIDIFHFGEPKIHSEVDPHLILACKFLIHILGVPEVQPRLALAGVYM